MQTKHHLTKYARLLKSTYFSKKVRTRGPQVRTFKKKVRTRGPKYVLLKKVRTSKTAIFYCKLPSHRH